MNKTILTITGTSNKTTETLINFLLPKKQCTKIDKNQRIKIDTYMTKEEALKEKAKYDKKMTPSRLMAMNKLGIYITFEVK